MLLITHDEELKALQANTRVNQIAGVDGQSNSSRDIEDTWGKGSKEQSGINEQHVPR